MSTNTVMRLNQQQATDIYHAKKLLQLVKDLSLGMQRDKWLEIDPETLIALVSVVEKLLPDD